jgi:hypothetical protein
VLCYPLANLLQLLGHPLSRQFAGDAALGIREGSAKARIPTFGDHYLLSILQEHSAPLNINSVQHRRNPNTPRGELQRR